ncbi:MAG: hypothetical protein CM1200mP23_0420 [Nitrososphaerota archaeon]|nr:MAG: hypothetical protein CM1200mP23_0420 [Nitrososphaerota archaeon]
MGELGRNVGWNLKVTKTGIFFAKRKTANAHVY